MGKIKFTKGELKRQRDSLKQFERYLPTLQLKKQQIQLEILHQVAILEEKNKILERKLFEEQSWAGLLSDPEVKIGSFLRIFKINTHTVNIAGADIEVFENAAFENMEYDLFSSPLWLDLGIVALREIIALEEEVGYIKKGIAILRQELSITTQRVNLFEKVKIPQALENIRLIKIYMADQMANAVGRSKIAKHKIEELSLEEALL